MTPYCIVLITVPTGAPSRRLATSLVKNRLAACVNEIQPIRSCYWWDGKVDVAKESLLIVKTRKNLFKKLSRFVAKNHSYAVPEIISIPILSGNKPYLHWLNVETASK